MLIQYFGPGEPLRQAFSSPLTDGLEYLSFSSTRIVGRNPSNGVITTLNGIGMPTTPAQLAGPNPPGTVTGWESVSSTGAQILSVTDALWPAVAFVGAISAFIEDDDFDPFAALLNLQPVTLDARFAVEGSFAIQLADVTSVVTIYGSELDDLFSSGTAGDYIEAGAGNDTVESGAGNDRLFGEEGADSLLGGDGADTLNGGTGDDFLFGGATGADVRDVIFGGDGHDSADGGAGNDNLNGGAGNDTVIGGLGADTITGNEDDDLLGGSGGADVLSGNAGNDTLNGGFGYDRVNGGAGADSFFHAGVADHGSDWIQDYSAGLGDVLTVGLAGATRAQFQVNITTTTGAGSAGVAEAFVVYRPTGQILWALVDGGDDTQININIGGQVFDLLA